MERLPAILDVRDDLRRIAATTENADATAAVEEVLDRLDEFADRDLADREGLLDDVENRLLALAERLDGEAARRAEAARNRVHLYREAVTKTADALAVTATAPERVEADDGTLPAGDAVLSVTVVNDVDETRAGVLLVTFYEDDGTELAEHVGPAVEFDPADQRTAEVPVTVPPEAAYYTVAAVPEGRAGLTGSR